MKHDRPSGLSHRDTDLRHLGSRRPSDAARHLPVRAAGAVRHGLFPRRLGVVLVAVIALALTGCGSSSGTKGSASGGQASQSDRGKNVKVSLLTLFRAGLAIQLNAGAEQAAKEYGAKYKWFGPPGLDPPTQIKALQDAVAAGTKGIATMAFPGELWVRPIANATTSGATVVTLDVPSEGSKATTHFGPSKYAIGSALADAFAKRLGSGAHGFIQPGICVPGLPSLTVPFVGFTDRMRQLEPGVEVRQAVNVTGDSSTNFTAWQRLIGKDKGALGFIGNCDQDVPNLIKIKKDSGGKYLIGSTSGDSSENVAAVRDGTMDVIVGQTGFVDGYVTMHMLLAKLVDKKPLPDGWVNTGYETITKDNAAAVLARQSAPVTSPGGSLAYFRSTIDKVLANPAPRPISDQLKPTTTQ